jgi:hypothetical protein
MTTVESVFHYGLPPEEKVLQAFARVRQVYGVRKTWLNETAKTIRVEYDASRLGIPDIASLLRSAGIDVRRQRSTLRAAHAG